jgi:1,2-diacylglycerol 3-beta-galactosyltransferase
VLESGYLLHPKYLDAANRGLDRNAARLMLGLDPDALTVLVTMGGFGGEAMAQLLEGLDQVGRGWQVVAICGRNEDLKARLEARGMERHKLVAVGFTLQLEAYLRAADLTVGKPGPASVLEAVAMRSPLVMDAAAAMPQEEPNADLIALHGMGLKVAHRHELPRAVAALAEAPAARACMAAAQAAYALPDAGKALIDGVLAAARKEKAAA